MKKFLFLFLLMKFLQHNAIAQDSLLYKYPLINVGFIKSCITDTRDVAISPLDWRTRQWLVLGAFTVSGALLYSQEEPIRHFTNSHQSDFPGQIAKYGLEPWGSGKYSVPLIGGMYLLGRITGNDRTSATALTAAKAACISSLIVAVTKQVSHRHRPYQDDPASHSLWDGPFSDIGYTSFPSGHSALAFSIATVLALEYKETIWVPVLAYAIASGTSLSRVYNDKHWSADVLAGSLLGYVTAKFLWKKNKGVKMIPSFSGNIHSLNLFFTF